MRTGAGIGGVTGQNRPDRRGKYDDLVVRQSAHEQLQRLVGADEGRVDGQPDAN